MLYIEEARAKVLAAVEPLEAEAVAVADAAGRVLAEPVLAAADAPGFDNSAMDGFAALAGPADRELELIGESRAGAPFDGMLAEGQAIRISTGAQVPAGDSVGVLEVERTEPAGERVRFTSDLAAGRNVRRAGEDLRAGSEALAAGTRIGPAEVAVAIAAGADAIGCARRPTVAIVNTGDELVPPGEPLGPGQIHDSNGAALAAAARVAGAQVASVAVARDTPEATRAALQAALQADVVVATGGVSVGEHDHVKDALAELGVDEVFWGVALKPGKPTWFGVRRAQLVFGLPGNPVSAYVTFALFARPALLAVQGADPLAPRGRASLATAVARDPARDQCVRVTIEDGVATPTGPQGSHVSSSLAGADALALIERGEGELAAGTVVAIEAL